MSLSNFYCCRLLKTSPISEAEAADSTIDEDEVELDEEGDVVLVEKVHEDGTIEKIVFASGGEVDVYELEILCDKVSHLYCPEVCDLCGCITCIMSAKLEHLWSQNIRILVTTSLCILLRVHF